MSSPTIDYDALAQQHGGTAAVDYDALAAQHGGAPGLSSEARQMSPQGARFFAQQNDSGVLSSLKRTGKGLANLPANLYKAITTPAQTPEEIAAVEHGGGLSLAINRLIGDPMLQQHEKAKQLRILADLQRMEGQGDPDYTNHLANMHDIGSAVPVVGPLAAGITDRYLSGDKSGAVTDLATVVAAPEAAKGAAKGVEAGAKAAVPLVGKAAGVVSDIVDPDIVGLLSPRAAHLQRLAGKVAKVAGKLSPEAEAATAEGTASGPVPSGEAAPAPYRLSGNQIQDATTVTPRRILGPDRQLPAAPPEATAAAPAAPPKTGQVLKDAGVTQAMKEAGIAAPSASARAVRPGVTAQLAPRADIQFPPGLSGEDASLMQLTRYNINELRFMANKRGLPVSPKDTHAALIDKIQGSLTPDETAGFTAAAQATKVTPSKFPENNLMAQNLNDAASALQQAKGSPYEIASLRNAASRIQQHPESIAAVDLTKTKIPGIDKRIGKRIADFLEQQKAVPGQDEVQTTTGQPMSMLEAMRASLIQRGVKPPY
jgi:hypothetical protein